MSDDDLPDNVLQFPETECDTVWGCECGCQIWVLWQDGVVSCFRCEGLAEDLRVVWSE